MNGTLAQLLEIEAKIKQWISIDNGQAFLQGVKQDFEQVPTFAQGVEPEVIAAAVLRSIEAGTKILYDVLGIEITSVGSVVISNTDQDKEEKDDNHESKQ